jgi:hypothetical protein
MTTHFVIPDTQVKPDTPTDHLEAAGNYIVAKRPDVIIHLGDHWDMHSLSRWDKGKKSAEGSRYVEDIDAGKAAMERLMRPIDDYNRRCKKGRDKQYNPRWVFLEGNHEYRIMREAEDNPQMDGKLSLNDLGLTEMGWEQVPFLKPIDIDGVLYCHYFVNTMSLKKNVIGGTIDNKLKHIGQSFTMGHQQTLQIGMRWLNNGKCQRGIVSGSFYEHDEPYMGPQGNHHYRGCLMKHEVEDGNYCLMELSLDYLKRYWL